MLLVVSKLIDPIVGRGVGSGSEPPPTQSNFTMTFSKNNANASVANDKKMPPNRRAGSARSAPTSAASAAPMIIAISTDMPKRVASCAVVHAPIAAKVAIHKQISPAIPVITVIDRKIVARIVAWMATSRQFDAAWKKT